MSPTTRKSNHVGKVVFPKPMAGTVSSANGTISEDASTEDIGRLINAHMTARREVAAMPNVIAADVAMPIETSDNPLAVAQVEEWMRVGREGDEEQDGYLKTVAAKRSSERLKTRGRAPTLGCSEFRATQKRSRTSRSFSEGAAGTGDAFFTDPPAVDEHAEATRLLQTLADAPPQSTHNSPLEELAIVFMTQANNRFGDDLNIDDATRLLRDNHCNVDDALEAYGRHRELELAGDKRHIVDTGVKEVDSEGVVAKILTAVKQILGDQADTKSPESSTR